MTTLLIKNARCIATFDHQNPTQARELRDASILIRDKRIETIGTSDDLPQTADEVIDASIEAAQTIGMRFVATLRAL